MSLIVSESGLMPNPLKDQLFIDRYKDYSLSAIGTLRTLNATKGLYKLKNEFCPTPLTKGVEANIGTAIGGLGLVRILPSAKEALSAVHAASEETGDVQRKVGIAIREVTDALASFGNAASFVSQQAVFRNIGQVADLVSDSADLAVSFSDWSKVSSFEDGGKEKVAKAIAHTKNYYWLRTVKAVGSVLSAILSVGMIFLGIKVMSAVVMTLLSFTTNAIAIRRDLWKTEGDHQLISLS